jgi:hypothetical protein
MLITMFQMLWIADGSDIPSTFFLSSLAIPGHNPKRERERERKFTEDRGL